jgi:hypothetical protein
MSNLHQRRAEKNPGGIQTVNTPGAIDFKPLLFQSILLAHPLFHTGYQSDL